MNDHTTNRAGETAGAHVITPDSLRWAPGPNSLPAGAQIAVIEGDPTKEGPFTMRAKVPNGWRVMPHFHPSIEHITVLQGSAKVGMGDRFDLSKATQLPTGSFSVMPTGHHHFFQAMEDSVIQLHGQGPWGITYVNPGDDPRRTKAGGGEQRTPLAP